MPMFGNIQSSEWEIVHKMSDYQTVIAGLLA